MAKIKQADGYQVKQVLADKVGELNAFGWNKVKNSTRVIKKKTYVNVRRKLALSKIPDLRPLESKYEKWSKKKIKKNPIGGIFAFLFMIVFFAVALVGLYVGLTDNILSGKAYEKSIAIYNAAVEKDLITAKDLGLGEDKTAELCVYDEEGKAVKISDGYTAFVKKGYIAYSAAAFINNYTYLNDEDKTVKLDAKEDADTISAFVKEYIDQLDELKYVSYKEDADDDAIAKAKEGFDTTVVVAEDGTYSVKAGGIAMIDGIVDGIVRPLLQGFGLGYAPLVMGFGIPLVAGAAAFVLFLILLIVFIRICGAKKRIEKRELILSESMKEAAELVYGVKLKNRDLMTKTERRMHDMQSMIVRAIHQASEDDDDD